MDSPTVCQALGEELIYRRVEMLGGQNAELLRRAQEMQDFIRTVPSLIASARMDKAEGKPTKFNYKLTAKLLATL